MIPGQIEYIFILKHLLVFGPYSHFLDYFRCSQPVIDGCIIQCKETMTPPKTITVHELSKHAAPGDLWTVVDGTVYDLTEFAPSHPGGSDILLRYAGRDATSAYNRVHSPSLIKTKLALSKHVGRLDDIHTTVALSSPTTPTSPSPPTSASTTIPPLGTLFSFHDFAAAAAISFPAKTYAFVSSAATDLHTHRANSSAYSSIGLRPRVLCDVSSVSTNTSVLGHGVSSPVFCAPTSLGKTVHPDGEKALGRACKELGIAQVVSTSASFSLDEIMEAITTAEGGGGGGGVSEQPVFFQLYVDKDRSKSEALLRRAGELGIKGLFLTVDAPVPGKREADERVQADEDITNPMTGERAVNDKRGGGLGRITGKFLDSSVSWEDLKWLRGCLPKGVPIILKGIQTAMDALKAMEAGVEGIVVSNHGGRSLDTAPATVLVLLELQRCCPEVFDRMEVFVDGGITRGTDVFKALCLGARGVGVGRGMLYALGGYGEEGVKRFVEILNDELETTMKMCGITSLDQVHPGLLNTGAVDHLIPRVASEEGGHPYAKWSRRKAGRTGDSKL
ncbi:FMN-dependent dehydrogenase [Apodospora peruviana]|uniref:L-lactate dehydrogenase (cytochrome) n=1 Tax=Apodospora peruviana TaxID=516989 RepID=A0AAE0IIE2_9PEZI|nr:FMN-dependent dehydrogenase [Apodospora peruviana]